MYMVTIGPRPKKNIGFNKTPFLPCLTPFRKGINQGQEKKKTQLRRMYNRCSTTYVLYEYYYIGVQDRGGRRLLNPYVLQICTTYVVPQNL